MAELLTRWERKGFREGLERGLEQGLEQGLERGLEQGLEQGLERGLEQGLERGLEQGLEQGRVEGVSELVFRLLGKRGITPDPATESRIRDLDRERLLALAESAFEFHSSADLDTWLGQHGRTGA